MRKSHDNASSSPPPAATPLIAAITGISIASISSNTLWMWRTTRRNAFVPMSASAPIPRTSSPAEKPRPSPVITSARSTSSFTISRIAAAISSRISRFHAFSRSGRFSVSTATPPSRVSFRYSYAVSPVVVPFIGPPFRSPAPGARRPVRPSWPSPARSSTRRNSGGRSSMMRSLMLQGLAAASS